MHTLALHDYITMMKNNVLDSGGDGSVVFNVNASSSMITCYKIMSEYAKIRGIKNIPVPDAINSKSNDTGNHTEFKFARSLNTNTINDVIDKLGITNAQLSIFSTINLEINE
jgi:hypothetical protein